MDTRLVGNATEAYVIARLSALGYFVSLPYGGGARYDILRDNRDGTFTRGQCKTGRLRNGAVLFSVVSTRKTAWRKRRNEGYAGEVDVFWVYCPDTCRVYEVPFDKCTKVEMALRVSPPRNGQKQWRDAADFEI